LDTKYYGVFNSEGCLETRLISGVHDVPSSAIEMSHELWIKTAQELDGVWSLVDGKVVKKPFPDPPPLTTEQTIELFRTEIQKHMDAAAAAAGYDDIKTAVTYADEPAVPKFQAEGIAFRAWRSLVWAYGYEQMSAVQSGARELPTIEALIAELPPLVMP
jgi:hypothetical protein